MRRRYGAVPPRRRAAHAAPDTTKAPGRRPGAFELRRSRCDYPRIFALSFSYSGTLMTPESRSWASFAKTAHAVAGGMTASAEPPG